MTQTAKLRRLKQRRLNVVNGREEESQAGEKPANFNMMMITDDWDEDDDDVEHPQ